MSRNTLMLVLATVGVAMFALPTVASAEVWHREPASSFIIEGKGGVKLVSNGATMTCTTLTGSGSYDAGSTTTGKLSIVLGGCTGPLGVKCTGEGDGEIANSQIIRSTNLPFHNIMIDAGMPGVLITPPSTTLGSTEGIFTSYVCFGVTTAIEGNGIIARIESPACQTTGKEDTLIFEQVNGDQKYQQITTVGEEYDLTSLTGTGFATVAIEATAHRKYEKEGKINCTNP